MSDEDEPGNSADAAAFASSIAKFALEKKPVIATRSRFWVEIGSTRSSSVTAKRPSQSSYGGPAAKKPRRSVDNNDPVDAKFPSVKSIAPKKRKGKANKGKGSVSKDEVLQPVGDILDDELDILFCGINPGVTSSRKGHHFSHPSNRFWPALYAGGLTEYRMSPEEDGTLPSLPIRMGLTNLCGRPSVGEADLAVSEHTRGARILLALLASRRPRIICFVGMGIWTAFFGHMVKEGIVPVSATSSAKGKAKTGGGLSLGPAEALKPYKLVHRGPMPRKSEHDSHGTSVLTAVPEPTCMPRVKRETSAPPPPDLAPDTDMHMLPLPPPIALVSPSDSPDSPEAPPSASVSSELPMEPISTSRTVTVKLEVKLEPEPDLSLAEEVMRLPEDLAHLDAIEPELALADETKPSPVGETLFFVMPNTSGLVAGCKPAQYAEFIATLKQRVMESRAGLLNTTGFAEIRYKPDVGDGDTVV